MQGLQWYYQIITYHINQNKLIIVDNLKKKNLNKNEEIFGPLDGTKMKLTSNQKFM